MEIRLCLFETPQEEECDGVCAERRHLSQRSWVRTGGIQELVRMVSGVRPPAASQAHPPEQEEDAHQLWRIAATCAQLPRAHTILLDLRCAVPLDDDERGPERDAQLHLQAVS